MRENKWRASRWGVEADIVLDEAGSTGNLKAEIRGLLERLAPLARTLRCGEEVASLANGLEGSLSYDRQRQVAKDAGSLEAVAASLVAELDADTPTPVSL
jgi:carboxylate-amine ligase